MKSVAARPRRFDYLKSMRLWTNFFAAGGTEFAAIQRHFEVAEKTVLEVGCGNGRLSIKLAETAKSVTGVDLDAKLIEFASQYARLNSVANLHFHEMSATDLTLTAASFDLILMPWMLHMVKDRFKALTEAHRLLRPGGTLLIFGLWGDCDYDRIARHFVSRRAEEIDPGVCYEEPLKEVFGAFEQEDLPADSSYSFIFPDCGVTVEAFTFAFENWYGKVLTEKEVNHLRHLVRTYGLGPHIELKTKGAIYIAKKPTVTGSGE